MSMKKQINHAERHKYHCQKGKAKQRGIPFELTFDEWWENHYGWRFTNIPKEEARKEWDKITEMFKESDKTTEGN